MCSNYSDVLLKEQLDGFNLLTWRGHNASSHLNDTLEDTLSCHVYLA